MSSRVEAPMVIVPASPESPTKQLVDKTQVVWPNALGFMAMHLAALYPMYLVLTFQVALTTLAWTIVVSYMSMIGTGIAAHRLYTHRTFTANTGLRAVLVALQTLSGQNCLYVWVRDHRQHHRFCDTNADPHNSTRGFFFSHIGWLMVRKHPDVISKGKTIDMSDLEADPIVMFQKKYYKSLYFLLAILLPAAVPYWGWGESLEKSILLPYWLRYIVTLNITWFVNSAAHLWGMRPYNKNIQPVENVWVSIFTGGEGWHNYHHQFPWDYRAAELGVGFNLSLHIIDWFAAMGWAKNLRTASQDVVRNTIVKHGDGTHSVSVSVDDKEVEQVVYKKTQRAPLRRGAMRAG